MSRPVLVRRLRQVGRRFVARRRQLERGRAHALVQQMRAAARCVPYAARRAKVPSFPGRSRAAAAAPHDRPKRSRNRSARSARSIRALTRSRATVSPNCDSPPGVTGVPGAAAATGRAGSESFSRARSTCVIAVWTASRRSSKLSWSTRICRSVPRMLAMDVVAEPVVVPSRLLVFDQRLAIHVSFGQPGERGIELQAHAQPAAVAAKYATGCRRTLPRRR